MFAIKTFKGAELNLTHYKGADIREYEIEFLNDDCTAMDISVYSEIQINIYHKKNGMLINSYSTTDSEITFNSPTDNFIYWSVPSADFDDLHPLNYYHECIGIIGGQKDVLFYGVSSLI